MKVVYGTELVSEIRNSCESMTSKFWLAVHYLGNEESIRRIIGKQWLQKQSISIRLLLDLTHINNIDTNIINLFNNKGAVKLLKGLHAKIYIIDDKCFLTSANLTETAFSKRYEIGVFLEGEEAKSVIEIYEKWWDIGINFNSTESKILIDEVLANHDSISDQLPKLWNMPIDPGNY